MSEQDKLRLVIEEETTKGVDTGFIGTTRSDLIEQKIENTVEISGAAAEATDLGINIDKLKSQLSKTKVDSVSIWLLCVVTFIARFV